MNRYDSLKREVDEIRARLGNIRLNLQRRVDEVDETILAVEDIQEKIAEERSKAKNTKKIGTIKERKLELNVFKKLIGRQVRIVNPNAKGQNLGIVSGVGTLYVLITLPNGESTRRMAKNLRLIEIQE